jgi:chromosome segregation ATPase
MEELRELSMAVLDGIENKVDELSNDNARSNFDLAVRSNEKDRLRSELEQAHELQQQLEQTILDLKTKHNRMLAEHEDKFAKDAKFVRP